MFIIYVICVYIDMYIFLLHIYAYMYEINKIGFWNLLFFRTILYIPTVFCLYASRIGYPLEPYQSCQTFHISTKCLIFFFFLALSTTLVSNILNLNPYLNRSTIWWVDHGYNVTFYCCILHADVCVYMFAHPSSEMNWDNLCQIVWPKCTTIKGSKTH